MGLVEGYYIPSKSGTLFSYFFIGQFKNALKKKVHTVYTMHSSLL